MAEQKNRGLRYRLYQLVEFVDLSGDGIADYDIYDIVMCIVIAFSLIPLLFKEENRILNLIDIVTMSIFIVDYFLRWMVADYIADEKGILPFLKHPFTLWAIIDLLSVIPSFSHFGASFAFLHQVRAMHALRVARTLRTARYSRSLMIINEVLYNSRKPLWAVFNLAIGYIFLSALLVFNVEPGSFHSFFDAIYWATVSLTTVGYGDIYPVTVTGRIVTMLSSFFGIAIVALPAGIITAGYMEEIHKLQAEEEKREKEAAETEKQK